MSIAHNPSAQIPADGIYTSLELTDDLARHKRPMRVLLFPFRDIWWIIAFAFGLSHAGWYYVSSVGDANHLGVTGPFSTRRKATHRRRQLNNLKLEAHAETFFSWTRPVSRYDDPRPEDERSWPWPLA